MTRVREDVRQVGAQGQMQEGKRGGEHADRQQAGNGVTHGRSEAIGMDEDIDQVSHQSQADEPDEAQEQVLDHASGLAG